MGNISCLLLLTSLALSLSGCNLPENNAVSYTPTVLQTIAPTATPGITPEPEKILTICVADEPASLFPYVDQSKTAEAIRQAIYDRPFDLINYAYQPVIFDKIPDIENGSVFFESVAVKPGDLIVDRFGSLTRLADGVDVFPADCSDPNCVLTYSPDQGELYLNQMVVRFEIRSGLLWSDSTPLTASDSVYAYEIASALYPQIPRPETIAYTQSYNALDELTLEWRGVPGFRYAYLLDFFFPPMPRHAWGGMSPHELLAAEAPNRKPPGWGAYAVEEWTPGDHIAMIKNPHYFRADEGLPSYHRLTFRFIADASQALDALRIGECDILDPSYDLMDYKDQLDSLKSDGKIKSFTTGYQNWYYLAFGLSNSEPSHSKFFQSSETRRAIAMCLDREDLLSELQGENIALSNSYLRPDFPLPPTSVKFPAFDPQTAGEMLSAVGWIDSDGQPSTPRVASGVEGVQEGTPFEVELLLPADDQMLNLAHAIADGLKVCGIQVTPVEVPLEEFYLPAMESRIFSRRFDLALLGWEMDDKPHCEWFVSENIPGPYPEHTYAWGGINVSGYSNPVFDQACHAANASPVFSNQWVESHSHALEIFVQDIPVLPLFWEKRVWIARNGICGIEDSTASSPYWNIELWYSQEGC